MEKIDEIIDFYENEIRTLSSKENLEGIELLSFQMAEERLEMWKSIKSNWQEHLKDIEKIVEEKILKYRY